MNRNLLNLTLVRPLLLLMIMLGLGRGNAWGAVETKSVELSRGRYVTDHIVWTVGGGITIQQLRGTNTSTGVSSTLISEPRVYQGHILSFTAARGYKIKSISITYSTTYYGNSMTAGTAVSDNVVTDEPTVVSRTWATTSGGTHVVSSVSDEGLSEIYIQNVASESNTQLRIKSLSITYSKADNVKRTATVTIGNELLIAGESTSVTTDNGAPEITLTTSDASVASVSGSTITGVSEGNATITATWSESDTYYEGSEEFDITVIVIQDGVFDFRKSNYGSGYEPGNAKVQSGTWTAGSVTMTTEGRNCWYDGTTFRVYARSGNNAAGSMTFAVPEGYVITNITFEGTNTMDLIATSTGIYSPSPDKMTGTWIGSETSVTFTANGTAAAVFDKISVTYEAGSVKLNPELEFSPSSATATLGETFLAPELTNPHNLTVTYSSSDENVATVDASTGEVTLVRAGTTTITASFYGDETYKAGTASYTLTVSRPAAQPLCSYVKVTSTDDLTDGNYLIVCENNNVAFNGSLETLDAVGNTIPVNIDDNQIAARSDMYAASFTIKTIDDGYSIKSASGYYIGQTSDANGLASNKETVYTNNISFDKDGNADIVSSGGAYLRYNSTNGQTRFRYFKSSTYAIQKAVTLYKLSGVTLNASGYATYASASPIDYANTSGFTAWQITGVNGSTITFEKITTAVVGGTGVLLWGEANDEVLIFSATSGTDLDALADNKLVGITTPTAVAQDTYYGLSGNKFVRVNAGTVPAGKALLRASDVNQATGGNVKSFTLVFKDTATGIETVREVSAQEAERIFDLSGRRLEQPAKGINIINGKKVVVK